MTRRLLFLSLFFIVFSLDAQDTIRQELTIQDVFQKIVSHNQALKVNDAAIAFAQQGISVANVQRLPSVNISATVGYLGNATIIEKDFSSSIKLPFPHFANSFGIEATQLIFKGNLLNYSVDAAVLQSQVAELMKTKTEQDIKMMASGYFLDLYKLYNQKKVYQKNIALAQKRLELTKDFYKEGVLTKNNILRNELILSNLEMGLLVVNNSLKIVNKQLITLMNIPEETILIPTGKKLDDNFSLESREFYEKELLANDPNLKISDKNIELSNKIVQINKTEKIPAIALYAGNNLNRPITNTIPAVDAYSYGWQAGIALKYELGALWTANKKIKQSQLQVEQAKETREFQRQNAMVKLNAAYIKYGEAVAQLEIQQKNEQLAEENYRIVSNKYDNQLALIVDVIDAANTKLDAELQLANGEANKIYAYYVLLNSIGKL